MTCAATSEEIAQKIVTDAVAPLAAAGCAIRKGQWRREAGGALEVFFDLASVTKPMTAVAIARSGLDPRARLGHVVSDALGTVSERTPLDLLLAHRAGLDAHRPLYAPLLRGEAVDVGAALREAASARRADAVGEPPVEGFSPLYSDLGYVLAGEALARATKSSDAGQAIADLVLTPLGLRRHAGTIRELRSLGIAGPFAPTETVPWRGGVVQGAVHDENAWALTRDGGSGHAGIFATVDAVLTFGAAVLDALDERDELDERVAPFGELGQKVDLSWLVKERPGGTLRAGFDGKSPEGSAAGQKTGARSFGHLGFTGTSLWIDPDAKVVTVLLTNRVCPTRDSAAIRIARPKAHDALFSRALFLGST